MNKIRISKDIPEVISEVGPLCVFQIPNNYELFVLIVSGHMDISFQFEYMYVSLENGKVFGTNNPNFKVTPLGTLEVYSD